MSAIGRTLESVRKTLEASSAPVAVIDIGSNSVRLVIFDGSGRNPIPIFNEKVLAGLGRAIVTTGRLHEDGVERSLSALGRFSAVIEALGVAEVHAVATAAVREAENGAEFCARAADAIRTSIRVLSGEEEARLTAQGVLSGIPDANGLVGDLGGGSLELLALRDGEVSDGCTAPLGALRLVDQ